MMMKQNPKINIYCNEDGEIEVSRVVISTVFRTLYYLVICGALIIVLVLGMFPLQSMKFFETLGLKDRALDMVNLYVDREYKKDTSAFSSYADGLYYKMMLAEELYYEYGTKNGERYLENILQSTNDYVTIEGITERNKSIDENNLASFLPVAHASVFSFEDRVCNLNYFAAVRLNKQDGFLLCGKIFTFSEILAELEQINANGLSIDISQNGGISREAIKFCIFFGQLTEYINYSIENSANSDFALLMQDNKKLMNTLKEKLTVFKEFALSYHNMFGDINTLPELNIRQAQLYLMRCIGRLYNGLYNAADYLGLDYELWDNLMQVEIENGSLSISDYYIGVLLPSYVTYCDSINE